MNDLIRRSDAIKAVSAVDDYGDGIGFEVRSHCLVELELVPSADRPQGEWIDMGDFEQCSVCKGTRLKEFQTYYGKATWIKTDFCPNCGAKMDKKNDELDMLLL